MTEFTIEIESVNHMIEEHEGKYYVVVDSGIKGGPWLRTDKFPLELKDGAVFLDGAQVGTYSEDEE